MNEQVERRSSVALPRGLHVVRYASSGALRDFPVALVVAADGSENATQIFSAPGTREGFLDRPGAALVVRAQDAVKLEIALRRSVPSGSLDASFQIDSLGAESGRAPTQGPSPAPETTAPLTREIARAAMPPVAGGGEPLAISILGHVAMRGDVSVADDVWMAGPESPAPIEGLRIRSSQRDRLSVQMQVLVVGAQQWSVWVDDDAYAGTRGRGLSLGGVRMRLAGAEAAQYELASEALFLGSMVQGKTGRQIEFASPAGSEPLVGFKLSVKRTEATGAAQLNESPWQDRGSRVRVFKSSSGE